MESRTRRRSPGRSRSPSRINSISRSRSHSEQDEKSVIIGIRTHGHIGIKWMGPEGEPSIPIDQIVQYVNKSDK